MHDEVSAAALLFASASRVLRFGFWELLTPCVLGFPQMDNCVQFLHAVPFFRVLSFDVVPLRVFVHRVHIL